jgi:sugar O-acyltransferase (sialic acid O-acetyltransferase NeuD family)
MAAVEAGDTYEVVGMLDDNVALHGTSIAGVPVLGGLDDAAAHSDVEFLVCAGSGGARQMIVQRLSSLGVDSKRYARVVHPRADLPSTCTVGIGSIILGNVTLTSDVVVGQHVVLMPQVVLTHDDRVGDFATLCAGVVLGGGVRIGRAAYLGMNASVRQDLTVGDGAVLGMGSVLLVHLPNDHTWTGVPARPILRSNRTETLTARWNGSN